METVRLFGKILPGEPKISVQNLPKMNWVWQEQGFSFDFAVSIHNSIVEVECVLPQFKIEFLSEIARRAFDLARAAVNLAAFCHGYGLTVRLDEIIDSAGNRTTLLLEDKRLPPLATSLKGDGAFDQVFRIVAQEPTLIQLLGELIHAITVPHETCQSCALAVDGLKNLIAGQDAADKVAWGKMREDLRIEESYLKYITDSSKDVRHGKGVRIEGDVTTEVAQRAWSVMNRFLEYRKRGNLPLPEAEFPTLKA